MPFSNTYEYIDKECLYTDKDTGVLLNLQNITNYAELVAFESLCVANRLEQLHKEPFQVECSNDLLKIHKFLFQDVYSWAGECRKVEISKDGKQFSLTRSFVYAFSYIDTLLSEYFAMDNMNKDSIAHKLAEILDNVNFLHPFREGNGRTQREFIRMLAHQKGYELDLNPLDNHAVYERYMTSTINGDLKDLAALIYELMI